MSKHYALTQAFINGPAGPEVLADVGTTQRFSGRGPMSFYAMHSKCSLDFSL